MEEAIKVKHLKKYYRNVRAVDDISFSVAQGELFGFLGVNGAGKSTTVNMLCTLQEPTDGSAWVAGMELGRENEKIKKQIGVVYQGSCLDRRLTVKENLMLRGSLYEGNSRKLKENFRRVAEILELGEIINRPFGMLSGGQKQRCEIARALIHTPEILFLDEPTTGLDPAARRHVWETVDLLQKEMGMTVFLTTHYMEEAARADHIGIMSHGHFIEYGTPFALKEKYAKDKLRLIPKKDCRQAALDCLAGQGLKYSMGEEAVLIKIDSTIAALPLLEEMQELLEGFEVVQGTMDDVFLNVTKEDGYEKIC